MKKFTVAIIGAMLFSTALGTRAASLDLPEYGFSIEPLDSKTGASPATAVMTFLPVTDGFAPNINVNIQPYPGAIKDYATLSKGQFEKMSMSIISEQQVGDAEWKVEYKGSMQGKDLHFYARAVSKGGKVYLTTATATESQWGAVGEILRRHVDSFKAK